MKMEVSFKTQVEHPEEDGVVHEHDSPSAVNFGCDEPWFVAGDDGTDTPFYLEPAAIGVLIQESQTTSGMGVYPNDDGQKCISDLICGGRHDRSGRHAAQMEAERPRSAQLEHLPVVVLLTVCGQVSAARLLLADQLGGRW